MRRIAGLARDIVAANLGRDVPYRLSWILNYRCNCRCAMCGIWRRRDDGVIDAERVRRFFAINRRISWLNLSGGEIFLKPDLLEVLDAIHESATRLYLLDFPTTGLATERIVAGVDRVLALGAEKLLVTVSIDGPAEHHESVRGVRGGWERTLDTFAELRRRRSRRFDVFLGMTLGTSNGGTSNGGTGDAVGIAETLAAVRARLGDFAPEELHVNLLHRSVHYYDNLDATAPDPAWVIDEMRGFLASKRRSAHPVAILERRYQALLGRFLETGRTPVPCVALKDNCFIDPHWNVYPCTIWGEPAGNLLEHDLDLAALIAAPPARALRAQVEAGRCPQCWTPCEAYASILGHLPRLALPARA